MSGSIVFADESIVESIFKPSCVDNQIAVDILAEMYTATLLKTARASVLSSRLAETKKYKSLLTLFEYIATHKYHEAPMMNSDYARHVRRTWVDSHNHRIRTDPEIYLPGEVDADGEDDDSDDSNDEGDCETEDELPNVFTGMKRKTTTRSRDPFRTKVAKTMARAGPSTPALNVIDDRRPDITLIDAPVGESALAHPYGRHSCLYMEVKVDANKKPNPQEVVTKAPGKDHISPPRVKSILRQIADIARLHLSTRPFMRYSLHITLCGTIFNICLFDRAGGVVSKDYDLKDEDDFETFVRIIRRATCEMDAYELGLDPTVTPLDYLGSVKSYPRFKVEVGNNTYYTHGFPIWQSTTLQGRGTWVFGVSKQDDPSPKPCERLVLKNAWRASGRLSESTLYAIVNKLQAGDEMPTLRCVAEFVDGGDVTIVEEIQQDIVATPPNNKEITVNQRVPMRVSSHRRFVKDVGPGSSDPTLHRVVLASRGRSMVTYTSLVELLNAAKCAVEGLHALSQLGVDHRDVSIGNVLLGTDPEKAAGFISDLDLSSISEEAIRAAYPSDHDKIIEQLTDGEWRTGTALFMSGGLLAALVNQEPLDKTGIKNDFTFQHRLCHDLESLIWVVVYAMMIRRRNLLATTDPTQSALFQNVLDQCWGVHSYSRLWCSHSVMISTGCSVLYQNVERLWFPEPREAAFFRGSMRLIRGQVQDDEAITYDSLCALLQKHIQLATEANDSIVVSN